MTLNALVLCHDRAALQIMTAALDQLCLERECCASAHEAMEQLVQGYHAALILDFDLRGAEQVAQLARMAPPQRRPVIFAMLGVSAEVGSAFQAGANFVLYKPLMWEQLMRSLRAGHGFMKPDRRRSKRLSTGAIVYLKLGTETLPSMMLNLNEDGLAVQAPEPLPALPEIPLRFLLPGSTHLIQGTGEVLWADDTGRAGLFFAKLPAESRKHLRQWLAKRDKTARTHAVPRDERKPIATIVAD